MARKANIAREEIHQACWDLLEKDTFPNIPRVADFFFKRDGRRCSNTTLMNAIAEWEEIYREHRQYRLQELDESLAPLFQHFAREVTQNLGKLLDEKTLDIERQQSLKSDAVEGGYQSLSKYLCELQAELDTVEDSHDALKQETLSLQQQLEYMTQRYNDVMAQNHVLTKQLSTAQQEKETLSLNLSQKEVDMATLDKQMLLLEEERNRLKEQLQTSQNAAYSQWQQLNSKLDKMASELKSANNKDSGKKK